MEKFIQKSSTPDIALGVSVSLAYEKGLIKGWDQELSVNAFKIVGEENPETKINKSVSHLPVRGNGKLFLYKYTRELLGKDTENYPQQIGDCVSHATKNVTEHLICVEKLMKGDREKFRPIFAPYFYGTGRVYVGNGQLGNQDGSIGAWMAEAVTKYGVLAADEPGVPAYSGQVAKAYGSPNGRQYLDKWKPTAEKNPIKSAALVHTWDDALKAITNGYPLNVCSNRGFSMNPDGQGFHRPQGSWGHSMAVVGIDDEHSRPYVLIMNSWGDVHGNLFSFYDQNERLPIGYLRVEKNVFVNEMLSVGDTFAYSNFDGFPEQALDISLFKIVGE